MSLMDTHILMFKAFYRWRYHHQCRRATKLRLSGRMKAPARFPIFSHSVFKRAQFGKYDGVRRKKFLWIILIPLIFLLIWFLAESFKAIDIFQP